MLALERAEHHLQGAGSCCSWWQEASRTTCLAPCRSAIMWGQHVVCPSVVCDSTQCFCPPWTQGLFTQDCEIISLRGSEARDSQDKPICFMGCWCQGTSAGILSAAPFVIFLGVFALNSRVRSLMEGSEPDGATSPILLAWLSYNLDQPDRDGCYKYSCLGTRNN